MAKSIKDLAPGEVLALAISLEEDDARISGDFASRLKEPHPATGGDAGEDVGTFKKSDFQSGGGSVLYTEMKRFENQVAVVTGAGRGIGEAIAKRLASEGAKVAVVSRTEANSARTAEALNGIAAGTARPYAVDVADFDAVQKTGEQILADFGRCDVLVNNAGITRDTLAMRMSSDDWDVVLQTNLKGAFNFTRAVLRAMVKQRSGRIINISSVSGLMGLAGQANYAASKAGLIGMSKSMAREVASRGITVNVVAPGFIETDMTSVLSEEIRKGALAQIPVSKFGEGVDIAAAVAFFASAEASFITGQVLAVDGGMSM